MLNFLNERDKKTEALVYLSYTGVVDMTPELGAILGGSPEAKTTDFGGSCKSTAPFLTSIRKLVMAACISLSESILSNNLMLLLKYTGNPCESGEGKMTDGILVTEIRFETGHESLKELETGVFVAAGRFVVERGKPIVVEYKVCKVVKGKN